MTTRTIDLTTPLSFRSAFSFPLQSARSRSEVLWGALLVLIPVVGWILNMGHRIMMVHRMQHGLSAWPAWRDYRRLLRHGTLTLLGMVEYYAPAAICAVLAWRLGATWMWPAAAGLWLCATIAIPGYMSHYCSNLEPREIFNPLRALRRVRQGGSAYWRAWSIALAGLGLSLTGLLVLGVGFLVTSVWFWQVAGYSFAAVFTTRFRLQTAPPESQAPEAALGARSLESGGQAQS